MNSTQDAAFNHALSWNNRKTEQLLATDLDVVHARYLAVLNSERKTNETKYLQIKRYKVKTNCTYTSVRACALNGQG